MSAQLVAEHGLTINDYEALLHLSRAEEGRMRRVDLAEQLILTASGVTRLLDGLERTGWVERALLRERPPRHLRGPDRRGPREAAGGLRSRTSQAVRDFFEARFSADELETARPAARPAARRRRAVDEADCSG